MSSLPSPTTTKVATNAKAKSSSKKGSHDTSLRRLDILFGIKRAHLQIQHSGRKTPTGVVFKRPYIAPETFNGVLCDQRIVHVTGWQVHNGILGKVVSFLSSPPITGHLINDISIRLMRENGHFLGLAVNPSETLMIVTCPRKAYKLTPCTVYSLPRGRVVTEIGRNDDLEFDPDYSELYMELDIGRHIASTDYCTEVIVDDAARACFGPGDSILLVDRGKYFVQEFTTDGTHKRKLDMRKDLFAVFAVACSSDGRVLAVGSNAECEEDKGGAVRLLDYVSGDVIREIASGDVTALRFTPDNTCVAVVGESRETGMVWLYSCMDGSRVRSFSCVKAGKIGSGSCDIAFGCSGEVFMTDTRQPRVTVYSDGGAAVVKQLKTPAPGYSLRLPTAVAYVNGHLYVLDTGLGAVLVME